MRSNRLGWEWRALLLCCAFFFCTRLMGPQIRAASQSREGVALPVLMYHSLLKDPSRHNAYTVSPNTFENDLLYLKANGYETVVVADLIRYVSEGAPLPAKPVMITFDDGHLNNLTYAAPLLEKHGMRAVISVVGAYVEAAVRENDPNPAYAYVTWEDLKAMHASGAFEIQNHSFDLHDNRTSRGAARKEGEVLATYERRLVEDVLKMQQAVLDNVGVAPTAFAYPYGYTDQEAERVLRGLGFSATLTCAERQNVITRDPESLFLLGRYNRPSGMSTYAFMQKALGIRP